MIVISFENGRDFHRGCFAHELRNQTGGHLPCGCILVYYCPPFWFLSSRAKGPRGGCYVRSGGWSMTASFGPFTTDTTYVLTEKVSGSAADFCPTVVTETVTIVTWKWQERKRKNLCFFRKKSVKFIIFAPVIFVTRMSRFCHNRDMKMAGAKTKNCASFFRKNQWNSSFSFLLFSWHECHGMNFAFFSGKNNEIHRFRSC